MTKNRSFLVIKRWKWCGVISVEYSEAGELKYGGKKNLLNINSGPSCEAQLCLESSVHSPASLFVA